MRAQLSRATLLFISSDLLVGEAHVFSLAGHSGQCELLGISACLQYECKTAKQTDGHIREMREFEMRE